MTRTGGSCASITRACIGDVCVRSSVVKPPPASRFASSQNVSNISRAGWSFGMFSISKLYRSHSTSGPSTTWNPIPWKMPHISRITSVDGW